MLRIFAVEPQTILSACLCQLFVGQVLALIELVVERFLDFMLLGQLHVRGPVACDQAG